MATSWPSSLVSADFAADKPCTTTHAQELRDRGQVLLTTPWALEIGVNIPAGFTDEREIVILESWLDNVLHVGIQAWITGGGASGSGRARVMIVNADGTEYLTGDWVSFTAVDPSSDTLDLTVTLAKATLTETVLDDIGEFQNAFRLMQRIEVEDVSGGGTKEIFGNMIASYVQDS